MWRKEVMSKTTKILTWIAALITLVAALLTVGSLFMAPTRGEKIPDYANPQKALLVIDVQEDYTGTTAQTPFPYKNAARAIATINQVIEKAHKNKMPVIYVKQEFDGLGGKILSKLLLGGTVIKGTPGAAIDKRVSLVTDFIFPKMRPDAFSNSDLHDFLNSHQVNELYLVGLDAEFCVYLTGKGAINRGYKVNIITDSVLLLAEDKWNDLLNKYRKVGINLKTSQDILAGA